MHGAVELGTMCGIIGIVSRPASRLAPPPDEIIGGLDRALAADNPGAITDLLGTVNRSLLGVPGVMALADRPQLVADITVRLDQLDARADAVDDDLANDTFPAAELESRSAEAIAVRDVLWALRNDRLRTAREVTALAGREATTGSLATYLAIQQACSAIDRLEVRGRDSAGIHVFVRDHALDVDDPDVSAALDHRSTDPTFPSGSVRVVDGGVLSFVYKAAAEIGELGDNTAELRAAIAADDLLRRAVANHTARASVLGHTRWASVGIISQPNTHPLNSDELEASPSVDQAPYIVGALNGDVDNYADLKVRHGLRIHSQITTDAKVIPTLVARAAAAGVDEAEAFRRTVSEFEGSVAIGAMSATGSMMFAQRGSGQGLYVGLGDDCYIVASEPYGVVEEAGRYLRLDGEHGGEIVVLDPDRAGDIAGISRTAYDGRDLPDIADDLTTAAITTRDIDRGDAPHFLLKEISEAPNSFAKTLRGKIAEQDGLPAVVLDDDQLPADVARRLADRTITKVRVIGQGTAAIAGQGAAELIDEMCDGELDVRPMVATELSGFHLLRDMSDTLAIAVSQSGTTTDTNTTVDLLRARGAAVIAIVNRRGSDLADKADGVLYTSDGRDIEMSVASTKAFYSQIAAGALLACAISAAAGLGSDDRRGRLITGLRELPDALRAVLLKRPEIAEAAHRYAPPKRYWAVVGNGPNKVAANEVRIKLSELCYKSIPADVTEDKKHIDLSSEPMILVCAAGLQGSTADDVGKETAIFSAHKSTAIVVCDEGEDRLTGAATIRVPIVDPALGFVLSAMVGHLFGYEAALAIDASARPLREAREVIEHAIAEQGTADRVLDAIRTELPVVARTYFDLIRDQVYDGHLEASTAVTLSARIQNALAPNPVEAFSDMTGAVGTPTAVIEALIDALTRAIDELTRPIDAIKHQAKTVTVGISRSDEGVLNRELVQHVINAGAGRDVLSYRILKILAGLDPAVASVDGFTRYAIDRTSISVVDRGGLARDLVSRVTTDSRLVGTKHRVAESRELLVARGRRDGRTVIFVPEVKSGNTTGITLLHVTFHERVDADAMRGVLQAYDNRYARLVDWVTETEGDFDPALLGELPVETLLIDPISETADLWRR